MRRRHVHLSPDEAAATIVGNRHGKAVFLTICAEEMAADGHAFFLTGNGVWLTDHVPAVFLRGP